MVAARAAFLKKAAVAVKRHFEESFSANVYDALPLMAWLKKTGREYPESGEVIISE